MRKHDLMKAFAMLLLAALGCGAASDGPAAPASGVQPSELSTMPTGPACSPCRAHSSREACIADERCETLVDTWVHWAFNSVYHCGSENIVWGTGCDLHACREKGAGRHCEVDLASLPKVYAGPLPGEWDIEKVCGHFCYRYTHFVDRDGCVTCECFRDRGLAGVQRPNQAIARCALEALCAEGADSYFCTYCLDEETARWWCADYFVD